MIKPTRVLSIAAVALLAACGSDSSTGPAASQPVDLASAFTEMSLPAISAAAAITGGVALPVSAVPTGCGYVAASQNFVCPAITTNGLSVTSSYALFDAAGHSMSAFDANTVSSLRVKNTVAGTIAVSGDNFNVDGQQDQTLSGLQTSAHTLNGTATLNLSGTGTNATIPGTFSIRTTTTTNNVVIPARGSATTYPTSGTITIDQSTLVAAIPSITSRIVMTFNGTSKVAVTMTVDGLSFPGCTIDLANGTTTCH